MSVPMVSKPAALTRKQQRSTAVIIQRTTYLLRIDQNCRVLLYLIRGRLYWLGDFMSLQSMSGCNNAKARSETKEKLLHEKLTA